MREEELIRWVKKVTTEFYELVYADPWFSKIFRNIQKDIITSQQTHFMVQCLGGPKKFGGRMPKDAHPQIWIDDNIWDYREALLIKAFESVEAPEELRLKWLKIDEAFKHAIVNTGGVTQCFGRYKLDEIIYEPMPGHLKKKKVS